MVHQACETRDPSSLNAAVSFVIGAYQNQVAPDSLDRAWVEATSALCRTCQEVERSGDAVSIVSWVVAQGPLEQEVYFAHGPLALVDFLLTEIDPFSPDRKLSRKQLDLAVNIFLPTFTEKPSRPNAEVVDVGARLLKAAFALDRLAKVTELYFRCIVSATESPVELTAWVMGELHEKKEYRAAIEIFLTNYSKMSPDWLSVSGGVAESIIDCVEQDHNFRASQVLEKLLDMSRECEEPLPTSWVMRLMQCCWRRNNEFEEFEELAGKLMAMDLVNVVVHPSGVYRVAIDVALLAGEEMKAEAYFDQAVSHYPDMAHDADVLGSFAKFNARMGDWDAVRQNFGDIRPKSGQEEIMCGRTFVHILKLYIKTHTTKEAETMLKSYVDELNIPLDDYVVGVMANEYGASRDVDAFMAWLEYCRDAGFHMGPNFSNALLVNCRRAWAFSFRELRTLFRKLRELNPGFVDEYTERIMADAALANSKHGGKCAEGRVKSLRLETDVLQEQPARKISSDKFSVVQSMKSALVRNVPLEARHIYKVSVERGMRYSSAALRLAVRAELEITPDNFDRATQLIRDQQAKGEDITEPVNFLLVNQLKRMETPHKEPQILKSVRQLFGEAEAMGIEIDDRVLNRAALVCYKARHLSGALHYAQRAIKLMSAGGGAGKHRSGGNAIQPGEADAGYNLDNFAVLIQIYAELVDVGWLRRLVDKALGSWYREKDTVLRLLKFSANRVLHSRNSHAGEATRQEAHRILSEGARAVVGARKLLRRQGKEIGDKSVSFFAEGATKQGRPSVDFDEVPWLGRAGNKSTRLKEGGDVDGDELGRMMRGGDGADGDSDSTSAARELESILAAKMHSAGKPAVGMGASF